MTAVTADPGNAGTTNGDAENAPPVIDPALMREAEEYGVASVVAGMAPTAAEQLISVMRTKFATTTPTPPVVTPPASTANDDDDDPRVAALHREVSTLRQQMERAQIEGAVDRVAGAQLAGRPSSDRDAIITTATALAAGYAARGMQVPTMSTLVERAVRSVIATTNNTATPDSRIANVINRPAAGRGDEQSPRDRAIAKAEAILAGARR